jgi:glycosyltransferase involved in cell wall biosynthesis
VNAEIAAFFRRLGVKPERIRVIAPHAFVSGEALSDALPEPLGAFAAAHQPLLVSVGGLEPEYDVAAQIDVIGRVRARFPRAGLAVIGSGSLQAELRRQVGARAAGDHVLLCGDVPHAATMRAIAVADVLLRTTLYDGDAISVREALHLGTPVVATENGMRPAGVTIVPISDPVALQAAIERVLASPRRARSESVTPDESNLEAVLRVYEELAPGSTAEASRVEVEADGPVAALARKSGVAAGGPRGRGPAVDGGHA